MDFSVNKPYVPDHALLAELGFPLWTAPLYTETFVGEVCPYPEDEEPKGRTKIQIYVECAPAQFDRFVIERRSDVEGFDGMEQLEVRTGSGLLSDYWPMVLAVASNRLVVGQAKMLNVQCTGVGL